MVRVRYIANVAGVRAVSNLGRLFSEKCHVSPLSILGHCFDVVSLGKIFKPRMYHLTQVKMNTW